MTIFKTLIIHRRQALPQSKFAINSVLQRCDSSLAQSGLEQKRSIGSDDDGEKVGDRKVKKEKKPLHMMFGEAVGVTNAREMSEGESEDERYMIKNLKKLEKEISQLRKVKAEEGIDFSEDSNPEAEIVKPESLSGLFSGETVKRDQRKGGLEPGKLSGMFSGKNVRRDRKLKGDVEMEDAASPVMLKKLSTEMLMFIEELYKCRYFYGANFLPGNKFDASYFEDSYSREYIKFAADRFAKDHQEIAKWLSGSQVKTVALYGCPTLINKTVLAAKRLRTFFRIQEDTVCSKCILRESCNYVNQSVWNSDTKNLKLDDTMRVIILYALEATHPKLHLPDHFKATINLLLRDIINLSKTKS